jgi:hypothetical protein
MPKKVYELFGKSIEWDPEWGVDYLPDDEGNTLAHMLAFRRMTPDHPLIRDLTDEEKIILRNDLVLERKRMLEEFDRQRVQTAMQCLATPVLWGWVPFFR